MIGEVAALSCALCWAIASRMFRVLGTSFSPLALNFWKSFVSIILLLLITQFTLEPVELPSSAIYWLLFSGVIGIGLGDTFFFQALNKIGESQSLLLAETLAPICTALLAMAFIGEWLTWQQWLGAALVIFSVDVIIKLQRRMSRNIFDVTGYTYAALAALCQAVGAVISRDILISTGVDAFNASQVRLIGGMGIIILLMLVSKSSWIPKTVDAKKTWLIFFIATIIGTFAALYLQMLAFSHTKAAVVQTLFATSIILSLIITKLLGGYVNNKTFFWAGVALIGVAVLVV